jgi:hypothetical protein
MAIDTDRLVQIANELKSIDQHREKLLAELQRVAGGRDGGAPVARRPGRPSRSLAPAKLLPVVPPSRAEFVVPQKKPAPKERLTTAVVDLLKSSGGAHTAGDIITRLNLPATKRQNWSVSNALVRLVNDGRLKKDKVRGYRAA